MKHLFTLLALALPLAGNAQALQQQAAMAAQTDGATPPPRYRPMAPAGASARVTEPDDWKAANALVGQYPRGHRDIVRWEKAQAAVPAPAKSPQEPTR